MKAHKTVVDVLKCARKLIRHGWCVGTYARNKSGRAVAINSRAATRFCITGALQRCDPPGTVYWQACSLLTSVTGVAGGLRAGGLGGWGLVQYNDTPGRSKAGVLAALDAALAKAQHHA